MSLTKKINLDLKANKRHTGTFVSLVEEGKMYKDTAEAIKNAVSQEEKNVIITLKGNLQKEFEENKEFVVKFLAEKKIRYADFAAFGAASVVLFSILVEREKLVKRAILIEPTFRAYPTLYERILDQIEVFLPLGLPFRKISNSFDGRPYAQAFRAPVLIITRGNSSSFQQGQAKKMAEKMPNAWTYTVEKDLTLEAVKVIKIFKKIPLKCPQKKGEIFKQL